MKSQDPKYDNQFMYFFGPENKNIMERLITDFLPITINENEDLYYKKTTKVSKDYDKNEKKNYC